MAYHRLSHRVNKMKIISIFYNPSICLLLSFFPNTWGRSVDQFHKSSVSGAPNFSGKPLSWASVPKQWVCARRCLPFDKSNLSTLWQNSFAKDLVSMLGVTVNMPFSWKQSSEIRIWRWELNPRKSPNVCMAITAPVIALGSDVPLRASDCKMGKNAGACKKTPANIHARNLNISPGQNHYADHRSPGNAGLLV